MSELMKWVIKSKQTDPSDFYVRVDGSEFYIAYWAVCAASLEEASNMVIKAADEDLVLGKTEIIESHRYSSSIELEENIRNRVDEKFKESEGQEEEEVQLAAWVTLNKGIW